MPKMRGTKLPDEVDAALKARAKADGTTVSMTIRSLIETGLGDPDLSIPMSKAHGALVYVLRDESDGSTLYVGKSAIGLSRPTDKKHHKLGTATGGVLEVFYCNDAATATKLEARLIHDLDPPLNESRPGRDGAKRVGYYVKIDPELLAWIKAEAKAQGSTVIGVIEKAVYGYRDRPPAPREQAAALDYKDMKALAARIDTRKPTRGKKVATREDVKDVYAEGLHVGMDLGKKLAQPTPVTVNYKPGTPVDGPSVGAGARYATDEEAKAAGERVVKKHRKALERLAAHDGDADKTWGCQCGPNPMVMVACQECGARRPCLGCGHRKDRHWARGCVAGCNCSERRFR